MVKTFWSGPWRRELHADKKSHTPPQKGMYSLVALRFTLRQAEEEEEATKRHREETGRRTSCEIWCWYVDHFVNFRSLRGKRAAEVEAENVRPKKNSKVAEKQTLPSSGPDFLVDRENFSHSVDEDEPKEEGEPKKVDQQPEFTYDHEFFNKRRTEKFHAHDLVFLRVGTDTKNGLPILELILIIEIDRYRVTYLPLEPSQVVPFYS